MTLTEDERDHWKERIARRIDQAIESLTRAEPWFLQRLVKEARDHAIEVLGLTELVRRDEELSAQCTALYAEKAELYGRMLGIARGDPAECSHGPHYTRPEEIDQAINRRAAMIERDLLERTSLGRQILSLCEQKESLLDTLWLATSGHQIRELRQAVYELLREPTSRVGGEGLSIEAEEAKSTGGLS